MSYQPNSIIPTLDFPIRHSIFGSSFENEPGSSTTYQQQQTSQIIESSENSSINSQTPPNQIETVSNSSTSDKIQQPTIENSSQNSAEQTGPQNNNFFNEELYTICCKMNSTNALIYYNKCLTYRVNQHQLMKLTEKMVDRMFPDEEMGLFADFWTDLNEFKRCNYQPNHQWPNYTNTVPPPLVLTNANVLPVQLHPGNPNSLLNIIASDRLLYLKATQKKVNNQPKTLTAKEESNLLSLIKNHFVNHCSNKMTYEDMEEIAKEIQKYFDGEDETTYFKREVKPYKNEKGVDCERRRAVGKLYSKWNNRAGKESSRSSSKSSTATCYTMPIDSGEIEPNSRATQQRIRTNLMANQNFAVVHILDEWNQSRELRFDDITKYSKEAKKVYTLWPFYENPEGHILVSYILISAI